MLRPTLSIDRDSISTICQALPVLVPTKLTGRVTSSLRLNSDLLWLGFCSLRDRHRDNTVIAAGIDTFCIGTRGQRDGSVQFVVSYRDSVVA